MCIHEEEFVIMEQKEEYMVTSKLKYLANKLLCTHFQMLIMLENLNISILVSYHPIKTSIIIQKHWHLNHFTTLTNFKLVPFYLLLKWSHLVFI